MNEEESDGYLLFEAKAEANDSNSLMLVRVGYFIKYRLQHFEIWNGIVSVCVYVS